MSVASSLDRIVPKLSARQRALLILRALSAGDEPVPERRRIDVELDRREFNR